MTLNELYAQKGEIITTLEVTQAKLQSVNKQIIEMLNNTQELKPEN